MLAQLLPTVKDLTDYEQVAFGLPGFVWAGVVAFIVQWAWRKAPTRYCPNGAAWLGCIFAAMAVNYLLAPGAPAEMPARIWRTRTGLIGLTVGFLVHVGYWAIVAWLGSKWPWLKNALDSSEEGSGNETKPKEETKT